jgi:hypothetical protein
MEVVGEKNVVGLTVLTTIDGILGKPNINPVRT